MFIEFVGAPGTGKTTLTSAAVDFLRNQNLIALSVDDAVPTIATRTVWGKIISRWVPQSQQRSTLWRAYSLTSDYYRLLFIFENFTFWRYLIKLQQYRPISSEHQRLIRFYLNRMMGIYQLCRHHLRSGEVVIFDEGFAHRVTHFVSEIEQPDPDVIVRYVNLMPKPDLIFWLGAPVSVCVDRVHARGLNGRLRGKSELEVKQFITNSIHAIDIMVQQLTLIGKKVIEIDNLGNLNSSVQTLDIHLDRLVKNARG